MKVFTQHPQSSVALLPIIAFSLTIGLAIQIPNVQAQTARIESKKPANGKLLIKRKGHTAAAKPGTQLNSGDSIFAERNVEAIVSCPNSNTRRIPKNDWTPMGKLCLEWRSSDAKGKTPLESISRNNATLPYLITPRNSLLTNPAPIFKWNAVPGVKKYHIQLQSNQTIIWEANTIENSIQLPDQHLLKTGMIYSLIIKTESGKSSEADTQVLPKFQMVQPTEIEALSSEQKVIQDSDLTDFNKALQLAAFYNQYNLPASRAKAYGLTPEKTDSYNLNALGIQVLQNAIQKNPENIILKKELGKLYRLESLELLAIDQYHQALDLITESEDLEDWSNIHYELGDAYSATNQPQKALSHFQSAKWGFLLLENADLVNRITKKMVKITPKILPLSPNLPPRQGTDQKLHLEN